MLRRLLGVERPTNLPDYGGAVPRNSGEAVEQGEETAKQERRRLAIGQAPIADIPGLIRSQGVWVSAVDLPDEISGLFLHRPDIGSAVLVHSSHSAGRKRFSYAHEYAHALHDREQGIVISSRSHSSKTVEQRANAFAAAFLMPRAGVHEALRGLGKGFPSRQEQAIFDVASDYHIEAKIRSPARSRRIGCQDVARLAHDFGVSYQTALYRLKNLRHISHPESQELLEQEDLGREYLKALGMSDDTEKPEKQQQEPELHSEIAYLAVEAYRQGEISRGRILDLSKALSIRSNILLRTAEATHSG